MLHFMRKLVAQAISNNIDILGGTGFLLASGATTYFYAFEYIPLEKEYQRLQKTFEQMSEVKRKRDNPFSMTPTVKTTPYDSFSEI